MTGCQHCMTLEREIGEVRTIVDRLDRELLGNGQPGRCAAHASRLSRLERWRSWHMGAVAAIMVALTTATALGAAVLEGWLKR